jgi:hypothetical protein
VEEALDFDLSGNVAQHIGAEAVRPYEGVWVLDRPVDVGLGGEVDHGLMPGHRG